jgi:hypothetical protein
MENSTDRLIDTLGLDAQSAESLRLWRRLYEVYGAEDPRDPVVAADAAARFLGSVLRTVSENLENRGLGDLGARVRAAALDTVMKIALDESDPDD